MSNNTTLILTGEGYGLAVSPEAERVKADILSASSAITTVASAEEAQAAKATLRKLADFRLSLEKSRKAVKEPVIRLGKSIDKMAAEFGADVSAEEARVSGIIAAYAAEIERKRREAEAEARRQAMEAERLRQEEERKRREAEAAAQAAKRTFADVAAEIAAKEEAERIERERIEAERKAAQSAMIATTATVAGAKTVLDYEVTDIRALYVACPELVELTPKRREILAHLKALQERNLPISIPGLMVREVTKISAR